MSYYEDVYLKRLNRYGYDYQSRIQSQREREFENKLLKSVYRVDFDYENKKYAATLERYKQDESRTLSYLLTRRTEVLPIGAVLMIPESNNQEQPWLVYWLENIQASGYNRYVILRLTHFITWRDRAGNEHTSWAYLYGEEDNMMRNELRARSRADSVYTESLKLTFFILPTNEFIRIDDYLEIGKGNLKEAYCVSGYDLHSTPGVEYVIVKPVYIRDNTPSPEQQPEDTPQDFFWLKGGMENGST